jgi:hypothetical protein
LLLFLLLHGSIRTGALDEKVAAVTCIGIIISQGAACLLLPSLSSSAPSQCVAIRSLRPVPGVPALPHLCVLLASGAVGEPFLPYLEKTLKALDELEEYPHHNVRRIVVNCYDGQSCPDSRPFHLLRPPCS